MIDPKIENLLELAKEIASDRQEMFGCENHVGMAMDRIIPGSAYYDGTPDPLTYVPRPLDTIEDKLNKLEIRAKQYLRYDRTIAKNGFQGNREVDAAIVRLSVFDAHIKELEEAATTDEELRLMFLSLLCKINGMFLGREVLNRDFTFFTHGPVFDHFIQRDPFKSISQQDTIYKVRLLLMPRGSFKSVSDGVDTVQAIIVNPDIRIMFLTAALNLARDFVGEVKSYFTVKENVDPSVFQYIFGSDIRLERSKRDGEYQKLNFLITEGDEGKETEFICPARTRGDQQKKEVTIWAGSIGAGKVGKHCDELSADDAVDEKNTDTPKLISKTNKRIGMALKLVDPGGYNKNIGTPYAVNDWYSHVAKDVDGALVLIRPAKWLRKDINGATAIDRGVPEKELTDHDWTLLFEYDKNGVERLSHAALKKAYQLDPDGFPSQYLLISSGYKKVSFTEALIYQQTITQDQMPAQIEPYAYYILWDLADTQNAQSDYSVGSVLAVDREGRGYIVEIFRDRYTFHDLCYVIAKSNHDYKPIRIIIENARGAEKLKGDMIRASQDLGDKHIPLDFVKVALAKSAKAIRIGKLEPKLKDRRLFFLNSISCYAELVAEFRDFGSAPHDDIPDSVGFCEHVLSDSRSGPIDPYAAAAAQKIMNEKAFFDLIHNSPEQYIDVPIDPMPETEVSGTGNDLAGDLWNPFGVTSMRR